MSISNDAKRLSKFIELLHDKQKNISTLQFVIIIIRMN